MFIQQNKSGDWILDTDRGDRYQMLQVFSKSQPFTSWWNMQHQSELRTWQMDVFLRELTRRGHGDDFVIWAVYKSGHGYNQAHDIALMYHLGMKLWVLSTNEYHWLMPGAMINCEFHKDQAIDADLSNPQDRKEIYPIINFLNRHYSSESRVT